MSDLESSVPGQGQCSWEVRFDFQGVPAGEFVDLILEELSDDFTILAFKLLALKPGWTYVVTWVYK